LAKEESWDRCDETKPERTSCGEWGAEEECCVPETANESWERRCEAGRSHGTDNAVAEESGSTNQELGSEAEDDLAEFAATRDEAKSGHAE
jgi:hypothetical protein